VYFGALDGSVYALDVNGGKLKWNVPFKAGDAVRSPIVVDNNVLYFGSDDFKIYAVDASTGQAKWVRTTNNRVLGATTVAGGVVYAQSYDHLLYALDAVTGQGKWALNTSETKLVTPIPGSVR
jgi:outer membrane protein assembly factor BamB